MTGQPVVLDLFAGAGGLSLGFERAGFAVHTAIESDSWACETLAENHPRTRIIRRNIEEISDAEIESHLITTRPVGIIGGPPCQGFSHSNITKRDHYDPRNSLFKDFARFVRILKPEFLVLENVPGLLRTRLANGKCAIEVISEAFTDLGYETEFELLRAEEFGVPQIRERLFIIGRQARSLPRPFPNPTHRRSCDPTPTLFEESELPLPIALWDAISDLPKLEAGEGAEPIPYSEPPKTTYQKRMRRDSDHLWNHIAMKHSRRVVERFKNIAPGESQSDVPEEYAPRIRSKSNSVSARRYDQNNRRLHPDRPSHTIPASFYANFVHPFQHRNFTAREGARIQSFPDSYVFRGKPTVVSQKLLAREGRVDEKHLCQYNQIGNAVPPLLAQAIAANILAQL